MQVSSLAKVGFGTAAAAPIAYTTYKGARVEANETPLSGLNTVREAMCAAEIGFLGAAGIWGHHIPGPIGQFMQKTPMRIATTVLGVASLGMAAGMLAGAVHGGAAQAMGIKLEGPGMHGGGAHAEEEAGHAEEAGGHAEAAGQAAEAEHADETEAEHAEHHDDE